MKTLAKLYITENFGNDLGMYVTGIQQIPYPNWDNNCPEFWTSQWSWNFSFSIIGLIIFTQSFQHFRTDCVFSPNDKLLVTGVSVRKDEGHQGKLVFLDRTDLEVVNELPVCNSVSNLPQMPSCNLFYWQCILIFVQKLVLNLLY